MAGMYRIPSIVFLAVCVSADASSTRHFRGEGRQAKSGTSDDPLATTLEIKDIEVSLSASMNVALAGGDESMARRMSKIEKSIWQTFQALPKNSLGRLAPRSVRYIAHSYFAKEHGWLIKGLEPHGHQHNVTEFHETSILQDKAPAVVEAILETRRADQGLSLSDVVIMVAVLERLIIDESLDLLQTSYTLNDYSSGGPISETSLHQVLTSYLLVFEMGIRASSMDAAGHQAIKEKITQAGGSWQTLVEFEQDAVLNYEFRTRHVTNPFVKPQISFESASAIVEDLAETYGKWQNMECRQMKEDLQELDVDGSGHVPLSVFYSQPDTADYQFTESVEYLREIGALDEVGGSVPRVRIANYLAGPSNCIASHAYYSVCCLSDCEGLMTELEGKIQAPTASPQRILNILANLSSAVVDVPRDLVQQKGLIAKLNSIADRHGGHVPLHGRLFAQWLYHAFPSDCPFPHIAEDANVLTPGHWMEKKATAPAEDRQRHSEDNQPGRFIDAEARSSSLHWSEEEVLPLFEPPKPSRSYLGGALRVMMQLAMFLVIIRFAFSALCNVASASGCSIKSMHNKGGYALPF